MQMEMGKLRANTADAEPEENLRELWYNPFDIPLVLQFNKRDLADAIPVEVLRSYLARDGCPQFEAVTIHGQGVIDTLKAAINLVVAWIQVGGRGVEKEQPQTVFEEVLHRMNEAGGFEASVLASSDGLPIASVPPDYDFQTVAAMVAVLASVAGETQSRVGLGQLDEVSVLADDRIRLVCRYFTTGGEEFIMAVVVPRDGYYRRATNSAIQEIRRAWHS